MLQRDEKAVLLYLIKNCKKSGVSLINANEILVEVGKKHLISLSSLHEIMLSLSQENYIEYVSTFGKCGEGFCITLKEKAHHFHQVEEKKRKEILILVLRTCSLAVLSFIIGLILKGIFN